MSNYRNAVRSLVTDFRAGELDPHMAMRVDSKAYPSGAQSLKNALLFNTGAVTRRPGTRRLALFEMRLKIKSFEFDEDEKYICGFGANYLAIYDGEGTQLQEFSGATDCPWSADQARELTMEQSGDVAIICHRGFRPKVLKRTSLSTFTIANFTFDSNSGNTEIFQPYAKFALPTVTLQISDTDTGSGETLTASSPLFTANHVGTIFRIYGNEMLVTAVVSSTVATVTIRKDIEMVLDPNPFRTTDGSTNIECTHVAHGLVAGDDVTFSGVADFVGLGISRGHINGLRDIDEIFDEDHYEFDAGASATAAGDAGGSTVRVRTTAPTRNWDEQVFSAARGWPGTACFHENRLWFAGTDSMPSGIWSSHTGLYYRFDVNDGLPDQSIQKSIGFSSIRHLVSGRTLQIFADSGEFVTVQAENVGLQPDNTVIRLQTAYGASMVAPLVFDGATVFVQKNNKTVREFLYDYSQNAFGAADITTISQHLIDNPQDLAVLYGSPTRPEQYAIVVNTDGTLAVFHSVRAESLAAWVPWETRAGDLFDSICTLGDTLFFSVERDGAYYLERLDFDSGITLDFARVMTAGAPTDTFALGSAYAGKTVHVTSGDYYLGEVTADGSGTVVLDFEVEEIVAGYDYGFEVIPMPPDQQLNDGPVTGRERRIAGVLVHVRDTLSLTINGMPVITRQVGHDIGSPPERINGKLRHFNLGFDRDPVIPLTQGQPLPVTILGLVWEVSV